MSEATTVCIVPAGHLAFDYEAVLELARQLTSAEQHRLVMALLAQRTLLKADAIALQALFAAWDAESIADRVPGVDDAAYDALLQRLNGKKLHHESSLSEALSKV